MKPLSAADHEAVVMFAWWAALNPDIALDRNDPDSCERVFLAYRSTCRRMHRDAQAVA